MTTPDKSGSDALFGPAEPVNTPAATPATPTVATPAEVSPAANNTALVRAALAEANPLAGHVPFNAAKQGHLAEDMVVPVAPTTQTPQVTAPTTQTPAVPGQTVQPQAAVPGATPATVTDPVTGQTVPLATMLEERNRFRERETAAQQQLQAALAANQQMMAMMQQVLQPGQQQQQQPQEEEPINPEIDLPGYLAQQERRTQRAIQGVVDHFEGQRVAEQRKALSNRLDASQKAAEAKHTSAVVDAAYQAAKQAGLIQSFINKDDPYGEVVRWHQGQTALQSIPGGDLNAWAAQIAEQARQKTIEELRGHRPLPANIPPNLAAATSAASGTEVVKSTKAAFEDMFAKKPAQPAGARAA